MVVPNPSLKGEILQVEIFPHAFKIVFGLYLLWCCENLKSDIVKEDELQKQRPI